MRRRYAEDVETLAKILLATAAVLAVIGGAILLAAKLGVPRLPGDIVIKRDNFTFYAPLGLMIALSLLLTIAVNLFFLWRR